MLPKVKRLARADFTKVQKGKRAVTGHFSLSYHPSATSKAAVIVSKKVAKKATERHLLKRRVLALLSKALPPNTTLVVYARAKSQTLTFSQLREEVQDLLTKTISG